MPTVALQTAELLWRTALAAIPLAVLVAAACRWLPCRAATRHTLWMVLLLWFAAAPFLPQSPLGNLVSPLSVDPLDKVVTQTPLANAGTKLVTSASARTRTYVEPPASPTTLPWTMARSKSELQARLAPAADSSGPSFSTSETPRTGPGRASQTRQSLAWSSRVLAPIRNRVESVQRSVRERQPAAVPVALARPTNALIPTTVGTTQPAKVSTEVPIEPNSTAEADISSDNNVIAPTDPAQGWNLRAVAEGWLGWLSGLAAVQAAIVALPPIPAGAWLVGAVVLTILCIWRMGSFQRRLSGAVLAPPGVRRMTAQIARKLGLRRVPQVLMVHQRVSPMIWCSRRPRVILPAPLWKQLDEAGRRAILCHELAHLRRGDHWIRWGELLITACYWWHPIVWWVRRRLHEEADLCCDTWVTWLLPSGRRAYAEALLHTKQYLNHDRVRMPAAGMGVTSARAKRFARRLTMVMTQSSRPGLSMPGILLAVMLASAGWLAVPARSCPPSENAACEKAAQADVDPTVPESTFAAHVARKVVGVAPVIFQVRGDQGDELAEEKAERANEYGHKHKWKARKHKHKEHKHKEYSRAPRAPRAPRGPRAPLPPRIGYIPTVPAIAPGPATLFGRVPSGEVVIRQYKLSKGKLQKLIALMVRDDVPVLVRPMDEAIEVHATPGQHAVFGAFVAAIEPSDQVKSYGLSEGKLGALVELMVLDSVPVKVSPSSEAIKVYANGTIQKVFGDFVILIDPDSRGALSLGDSVRGKIRDRARGRHDAHRQRAQRDAEGRVRLRSEISQRVRAEAEAMREQMHRAAEQVRSQSRKKRDQMRGAEQKIRQLEDKLQRLRDRRDEMQDRAQGLQEEAQTLAMNDEGPRDDALALERQARELEELAWEMESEGASLELEGELLEHDMELLELESEQLEEQAESLIEEAQEAIEARFEELIESIEEESQSQSEALEQAYERIERSMESQEEGEAEAARSRYQQVIEALAAERRTVTEASRNQYESLARTVRQQIERYAQASEAAHQLAVQLATHSQTVESGAAGVVDALQQAARAVSEQGPQIIRHLLQGDPEAPKEPVLPQSDKNDESL